MTNQVMFRASDQLLAEITRRDDGRGESLVAKRDLDRYYAALSAELRAVSLSEPEALLLCDALNGVLHEPHTVPLLWASIDDAIRLDRMDAKWGVDGADLVARLRALTYTQALAVIDAVERWWLLTDRSAGALQTVGLRRI